MSRAIRETFLAFCDAMAKEETDYAIVGAFAVSVWGNPRTTQDVDAVVDYEDEGIPSLVGTLDAHGFRVEERDLRHGLEEGGHVTVFDTGSIYHVDVKPATDEAAKATVEGGRHLEVDGHDVVVASPEDTIAHKLVFGSEQDIADAESVYVRQQGRLDVEHLEARCRDLGVVDALRAMEERIADASG